MSVILRLSLPLTVWLVMFSAVYALQGLSCSRHWPADLPVRPVLIAAWALACALQAISVVAVIRSGHAAPAMQRVIAVLSVTAMIAVVWTLLPVVLVADCR